MPKADIQARAAYLVSQYGGYRGASRATGIPRSTLTRIAKGQEPTKRNRERLNRQFRSKAPQSVKRREKRGMGAGVALVDEPTARRLERAYRQQGKTVSVVAHSSYDDSQSGVAVSKKEFGRGSSVDEAKANLEANYERLYLRYREENFARKGKVMFRVLPVEGTA